jgi:hypothetical protein
MPDAVETLALVSPTPPEPGWGGLFFGGKKSVRSLLLLQRRAACGFTQLEFNAEGATIGIYLHALLTIPGYKFRTNGIRCAAEPKDSVWCWGHSRLAPVPQGVDALSCSPSFAGPWAHEFSPIRGISWGDP